MSGTSKNTTNKGSSGSRTSKTAGSYTGTGRTSQSASKSTTGTSSGTRTSSAKQGQSAGSAYSANTAHKNGGTNSAIIIIIIAVVAIFLELCNFGGLGNLGNYLKYGQFGIFGIMAYIFPAALAALIVYINLRKERRPKQIVCAVLIFICLCSLMHLFSGLSMESSALGDSFKISAEQSTGGGITGGTIAIVLGLVVGKAGAYIVIILGILVCAVLMADVYIVQWLNDRKNKERNHAVRKNERLYAAPSKKARAEKLYDRQDMGYAEEKTAYRNTGTNDINGHYSGRDYDSYEDMPVQDSYYDRKKPTLMQRIVPRQEDVFEIDDDEGGRIIVNVYPGRISRRQKAALRRERKYSETMRARKAATPRSENIARGVGDGLDFGQLSSQKDEVREITDTQKISLTGKIFPTEDEAEEPVKTEATKKPKDSLKTVELPEYEMLYASELMHDGSVDVRKSGSRRDIFSESVGAEQASDRPEFRAESRATKSNAEHTDKPEASYAEHMDKPEASYAEKQPAADTHRFNNVTEKEEYKYPPLSLFEGGKITHRQGENIEEMKHNLEETLFAYGVKATVKDIQEGPSVTRYELEPELGTRVSTITKLADDLKLNLAVPDIRIEAPIPGKKAVGIEIPNKTKQLVTMRDLLEDPALVNHSSKIAFAAGKDISGNVIVADIARMPHLLVAGTTGSGKSTFVNTILMAILTRARPSEVGLIIVDPKKVEFGIYSGIPHLVQDVVTDPAQAVSTLRWAVSEMTNRYQRMQLSGVRDFQTYNKKLEDGQVNPQEKALLKGSSNLHTENTEHFENEQEAFEPMPKKMAQIVIVIDELADLMMVASKEAESLICRIAQLGRASGIHLIIATQRPSVDVVTGLIKANIPARVALLVASGIDSRTIIDMNGAEKLLGNGDMLFYPTGYVKPIRVQGAYVSDREVLNTVEFLKENDREAGCYKEEAEELENFKQNIASTQAAAMDEPQNAEKYDEFFLEAGRLCIETGKASSSMIQRRFSIGFNRAARIIDQLEEIGVIGPQNGSKPREILMNALEFEDVYNSL